jgi:hypothetical protein
VFFQTKNRIIGPSWDLVADFHQVFQYDFMTNAFIAGTVVAILAGVAVRGLLTGVAGGRRARRS